MDYLQEFLTYNRRIKRRDNSHRDALKLKNMGDSYIFNYLCSVFVNRIKWKYDNPEGNNTIATELIERQILFDGNACFHKLKIENAEAWLNFNASIINNYSFYNYPSSVQIFDFVGRPYGIHVPISKFDIKPFGDCVMIWDNALRTSPIMNVLYYANRLSYINSQINAAITNLRGTQIVACTEEQKEQAVKTYKMGNDGMPIVFITYHPDDINSFKPILLSSPEIPDVLKTLYEIWDKTMADYLNSIGIRCNNEINKKSGVTPLEITENRQNTDIILNAAIESRLEGIELAKRIGLEGLSVSLSNFEPRTVDQTANIWNNANNIPKYEEVSSNDEFEKSNIQ